jgi:hypothetical protein
VSQSSGVRHGRGETGQPPRDARHAGPGGAVGAAEARETKQRGGVSRGAYDERCISSAGGTGGWNEDIEVEARQIPGNKSGGGSVVGA